MYHRNGDDISVWENFERGKIVPYVLERSLRSQLSEIAVCTQPKIPDKKCKPKFNKMIKTTLCASISINSHHSHSFVEVIHTAFSTLTHPSSVGSPISLVTRLYQLIFPFLKGCTSGTYLPIKEYNPTPLPTFHTLGSLLHHGAFSIVNTSNTALCNSLTFPPLTCVRARSATF